MSEAIDTVKSENSGGVGQFVKETREELNKVTFPSSDDVRGTTMIVVINVIFFAIFLWLVDHGWTYGIEGLTWLVNKIFGY
ncbi:MAG: preprotein translocase subunit SecE [Pyrinomonadaceae bacterium]|nr:preprotein translocase subunit SecE [Pyrinomonadaceae bacterium]